MTEKVSVFSVKELDDYTKARIEKIFSEKHDGKVVFDYEIEPTLIGGLLIIDGNDYYDSTVAGKLSKVKRALQ